MELKLELMDRHLCVDGDNGCVNPRLYLTGVMVGRH